MLLLTLLMSKLAVLWLALTVAALALHLYLRDYITLSVAIGAGITFAAYQMGYNTFINQILVFSITTLVFSVSFIPAMIQKSNARRMKELAPNFDLRGKSALVTETVDNMNACGQVEIDGQRYVARSSDGNIKAQGTAVTIIDKDHHILIVR